MKSLIITLLSILGIAANIDAQSLSRQVISSGGGYLESGNYKLSFTFGEPIVEYVESGNFKLTQGFQQGASDNEVAIKEAEILVDYKLHPNPSTKLVNLSLVAKENMEVEISIIDMSGKTISETRKVNGTAIHEVFDISSITNGKYFLLIVANDRQVKNIPFIKQ